MKNREGFVSNSSSCSFIVRKNTLKDIKKLRDLLNDCIDEWEEELENEEYVDTDIEDHGIENVALLSALNWILGDDYYGRTS